MTNKQNKRPTRRKPDRPSKQHYFSTIPDYSAPWSVLTAGAMIAILPIVVITMAAYGHVHGWW